jgi:hypothetical protein
MRNSEDQEKLDQILQSIKRSSARQKISAKSLIHGLSNVVMVLLLSGNPVLLAQAMRVPLPALKASILDFSKTVDVTQSPNERRAMLEALAEMPVSKLLIWKLLDMKALADFIDFETKLDDVSKADFGGISWSFLMPGRRQFNAGKAAHPKKTGKC